MRLASPARGPLTLSGPLFEPITSRQSKKIGSGVKQITFGAFIERDNFSSQLERDQRSI
jgi:hypothetical protein